MVTLGSFFYTIYSNSKIVQWGKITTTNVVTDVKPIVSKTKLVNIELQCSQAHGFATYAKDSNNSYIRVGCLIYDNTDWLSGYELFYRFEFLL